MFGLDVLNNANSTLISSNSRPMIFSERGFVSVTNSSVVDRPAYGSVVFSIPVLTQAPPCVFIRLDSSRHSSLSLYVIMTGVPFNWTGFIIVASAQGGGVLPLYVLEYVVTKNFDLGEATGYGLMLYNEYGVPIFRHDRKLVKYSKFTKKWTLTQTVPGYTFFTFSSNLTIDADDFIDVSSINRGIVHQAVVNKMFTSLSIYEGSQRVLKLQTQSAAGASNPQNIPAMNFCIPVCKFPSSVYY